MSEIDWKQEARARRGELPRVRLSSMEIERRRAQLDSSEWVDYPAETGLKMNWPKALCVGPDGRGRVEDLTRALGWQPPRAKPSANRHISTERMRDALDMYDLGSPGYRVLGRKKIARYLGLSERQLSDRLACDPFYQGWIHRVGHLLVATMGTLDHLDQARQWQETEARRKANVARKKRSGGRKPKSSR